MDSYTMIGRAERGGRFRLPAGQSALLLLLDGGLTLLRTRRRQPVLACSVVYLAEGDWEWEADEAQALVLPLEPTERWPDVAGPATVLDELSAGLLAESFCGPALTVAEQQAAATLLRRRLLRLAGQGAIAAGTPETDEPAGPTDPVGAALAVMRARLDERLTLAELAAAAGVNRRRLIYLFQGRLQRPPMTVLTELRMQQAARYLQETDLTISQIARSVGYGQLAAFSNAFSRHTGQSPSAYRDGLKWLI